MQPAQAFAPNATTFLTHLVGAGLADTRYVVERFKSMLDGDIRPVEAEAPKGSRRRKAKRVLASLKEVKEMRPAATRSSSAPASASATAGSNTGIAWQRGFSTTAARRADARPMDVRPAHRRPGAIRPVSTPRQGDVLCARTSPRGAPATWSGITVGPRNAAPLVCA